MPNGCLPVPTPGSVPAGAPAHGRLPPPTLLPAPRCVRPVTGVHSPQGHCCRPEPGVQQPRAHRGPHTLLFPRSSDSKPPNPSLPPVPLAPRRAWPPERTGRWAGRGWGGGALRLALTARWMLAPRPPRSARRCSPSLAPCSLPELSAHTRSLARPLIHTHTPRCSCPGARLPGRTPASASLSRDRIT